MGRIGWTKIIALIVGAIIGAVIGYLVGHSTVGIALGAAVVMCLVAVWGLGWPRSAS